MPANTLHQDEPRFTVDDSALDATALDRSVASPSVPPPRPTEPRHRSRWLLIALVLALLLAAGLGGYVFWLQRIQPAPAVPASAPANPAAVNPPAVAPPVASSPAAPAATAEAPVPSAPALPALDQSDTVARDALQTILNGDDYLALLVPKAVIWHIVATVDNLPRPTLSTKVIPLQPVPGVFATSHGAQGTSIAVENAARRFAATACYSAHPAAKLRPPPLLAPRPNFSPLGPAYHEVGGIICYRSLACRSLKNS